MSHDEQPSPTILIANVVEEIRDAIERLLETDGYRVESARHEEDAVERAKRVHPDLILVSFGEPLVAVIATAQRIRDRAALTDQVPVVIFCVESIPEGAEVVMGTNVYITRPDNFNQLRALLGRLLFPSPSQRN